jgi:CheY-like chemotaxis protein
MRVLLVDDNLLMQQVISRFLMSQDCIVESASTADEAIQRAGDERFDLVMVDMHLPDRNGDEFLSELRTLPHYATVPTVAISGLPAHQLSQVTLNGFDAYYSKPIDLDDLSNLIQQVSGGQLVARSIGQGK